MHLSTSAYFVLVSLSLSALTTQNLIGTPSSSGLIQAKEVSSDSVKERNLADLPSRSLASLNMELPLGRQVDQKKSDFNLNGYHLIKNKHPIEGESVYFCKKVNQDFIQCASFDGND